MALQPSGSARHKTSASAGATLPASKAYVASKELCHLRCPVQCCRYLAPIKAMLLLVPASAWVALAALVVGVVAVMGMISQPANMPGSN